MTFILYALSSFPQIGFFLSTSHFHSQSNNSIYGEDQVPVVQFPEILNWLTFFLRSNGQKQLKRGNFLFYAANLVLFISSVSAMCRLKVHIRNSSLDNLSARELNLCLSKTISIFIATFIFKTLGPVYCKLKNFNKYMVSRKILLVLVLYELNI